MNYHLRPEWPEERIAAAEEMLGRLRLQAVCLSPSTDFLEPRHGSVQADVDEVCRHVDLAAVRLGAPLVRPFAANTLPEGMDAETAVGHIAEALRELRWRHAPLRASAWRWRTTAGSPAGPGTWWPSCAPPTTPRSASASHPPPHGRRIDRRRPGQDLAHAPGGRPAPHWPEIRPAGGGLTRQEIAAHLGVAVAAVPEGSLALGRAGPTWGPSCRPCAPPATAGGGITRAGRSPTPEPVEQRSYTYLRRLLLEGWLSPPGGGTRVGARPGRREGAPWHSTWASSAAGTSPSRTTSRGRGPWPARWTWSPPATPATTAPCGPARSSGPRSAGPTPPWTSAPATRRWRAWRSSPLAPALPLALQALQAGKHVYVQKPMAQTLEEADRLVEEASRRGLVLAAAPPNMISPTLQRIRALIQEGVIGKVGLVFCHSSHGGATGPGRFTDSQWFFMQEAGYWTSLVDMGVYGLHTVTGILGPARRVTALGGIAYRDRTFTDPEAAPPPGADHRPRQRDRALDWGEGTIGQVDGAFTMVTREGRAWSSTAARA